MDFSEYTVQVKKVFEINPVLKLREMFNGNLPLEPLDIINIMIDVRKSWDNYRKYTISFAVIVDNIQSESTTYGQIKNYDYNPDISEIIQYGEYKSIIYHINKEGLILRKEYTKEIISYNDIVEYTAINKKVGIFLGLKGIDILINGTAFESDNRFETYSDIIRSKDMLDISNYRKLLEKFFLERVQKDPFNSFFVNKGDCRKELHPLLDRHPKLLQTKPEKRFQKELEYFLKNNCLNQVKTEMWNRFGERYDVWISTSDDKLYVFEIKWLGKSLTAEGKIFDKYNNSDRALEGAYQLKKYIDDAEQYASIVSGDFRIHCGVLLTYDAREEFTELEIPEEFNSYPQLDLKQHFKIEKDHIPASKYYSEVIKKN